MAEEQRSLYYATLFYEDSVNPTWRQILEELLVPCLVSPLHNSDYDEQGNKKKNHRHALFLFRSLKSRKQFLEITEKLGSVGAEIVRCPHSYALYLTHSNAPEKVQYSTDDIIAYYGAMDYLKKVQTSSINKYDVIADIIRYCQANNIDCLADIIEYALENDETWFHILAEGSSSFMLANYLKSRTWRKNKDK